MPSRIAIAASAAVLDLVDLPIGLRERLDQVSVWRGRSTRLKVWIS